MLGLSNITKYKMVHDMRKKLFLQWLVVQYCCTHFFRIGKSAFYIVLSSNNKNKIQQDIQQCSNVIFRHKLRLKLHPSILYSMLKTVCESSSTSEFIGFEKQHVKSTRMIYYYRQDSEVSIGQMLCYLMMDCKRIQKLE